MRNPAQQEGETAIVCTFRGRGMSTLSRVTRAAVTQASLRTTTLNGGSQDPWLLTGL